MDFYFSGGMKNFSKLHFCHLLVEPIGLEKWATISVGLCCKRRRASSLIARSIHYRLSKTFHLQLNMLLAINCTAANCISGSIWCVD
ncbi:putative receptor-like protein [Trichinella spiralis]|uniref:Receptor-like protein n=1 Tax=Trichinella spiralis TaxID=6334 RepID=A0ABR3KI68_TRISP